MRGGFALVTTIEKEVQFQMTLDSAISAISNRKVKVKAVMVYPSYGNGWDI